MAKVFDFTDSDDFCFWEIVIDDDRAKVVQNDDVTVIEVGDLRIYVRGDAELTDEY